MRVAIFGTGYVGLVTGACFAEMGNYVTCVDIDAQKVASLGRHQIPIYEPGLHELVEENALGHRLMFTTSAAQGLTECDLAFICVGTPMTAGGEADLRYVEAVARDIGRTMNSYCLLVNKSTVPVGTADRMRIWVKEELQRRGVAVEFDIASNPEFLKEGSAVDDFMRPDRVVVGVDSVRAEGLLRELYAPFIRNGLRLYTMDIRSAEMTKYAANAMLATKISFINEVANICELVGADVRQVRLGVGADSRIGLQFLHPGVGYGGSCFPKDVRALMHSAAAAGYQAELLRAVDLVNQNQKGVMLRKLEAWCELEGRSLASLAVAVWGLAFKPNTDDVRESPALELIQALVRSGATVRAHDPKAIGEAHKVLGDLPGVVYCEDPYQATQDCDVLCLMTEWRPYRRPDFRRLGLQLRGGAIFDGRNQFEGGRATEHGLRVFPIGVAPAGAARDPREGAKAGGRSPAGGIREGS